MMNMGTPFPAIFPSFVPPILSALLYTVAFTVIFARVLQRNPLPFYLLFAAAGALILTGIEDAVPSVVPLLEIMASCYTGVAFYLIVMFAGALPRSWWFTKRLLSVRSQISILAGFVVFFHIIRVWNLVPLSFSMFWPFIWSNAAPIMTLGFGVVGPFLVICFFIPWITSFKTIRNAMTHKKWKRIQKLAYPFMVLLILQGILLAIGHAVYVGPQAAEYVQYILTAITYTLFGLTYAVLKIYQISVKHAKASQRSQKPTSKPSLQVHNA